MFTEEVAARVCEKLQRVALPQLSAHEQMQLVDIAECVGTVEKQRRSLDENGARFIVNDLHPGQMAVFPQGEP